MEPRDASRLLVFNRESGQVQHSIFTDLGKFLQPGDLLVVNRTRVIHGRLFAYKLPTGGKCELLLIKKHDPQRWEALVGGKGLAPGKKLQVEGGPQVEIEADLGGSHRLIRFEMPIDLELDRIGHVPLPPYIHTSLVDPQRYQTVFADIPGSAAAPTAGLHFSTQLVSDLHRQGIGMCEITLHIGLDTFAPVTEATPAAHRIHTEWCQVDETAAQLINATHRNGSRVIAVGTSSVRALESAKNFAAKNDLIGSFAGPTDLFILPGYRFMVVDAMITNFHLPRSTLIMLVSAFAGRERIMELYQLAIQERYRFYSFGDAMLLL